jgi:DNA-binding Xre family transcriptional regulator
MIRLRVKEVAQQKKMSQGLLSRLSNVDINTLREIMHDDRRNITLETLNRLANGLQVDARDLIDYTPDTPVRSHESS